MVAYFRIPITKDLNCIRPGVKIISENLKTSCLFLYVTIERTETAGHQMKIWLTMKQLIETRYIERIETTGYKEWRSYRTQWNNSTQSGKEIIRFFFFFFFFFFHESFIPWNRDLCSSCLGSSTTGMDSRWRQKIYKMMKKQKQNKTRQVDTARWVVENVVWISIQTSNS